MVTELFPSLQKRIRGKEFWETAARWMLAGTDEKVVFNVMDPDGPKRAMYMRPGNFPDCFASVKAQSSMKPADSVSTNPATSPA